MHHTHNIIILIIALFAAQAALAQVPLDKKGLLNGEEMGQASTADLNAYPEPAKALSYAKEMLLSAKQIETIQKIRQAELDRAKELGQRIIQIEGELDESFKSSMLNERSINDDAEQIGKLRGRLRAAHLVAYWKTRTVLNQTQLEKYRELRNATTKQSKGQ